MMSYVVNESDIKQMVDHLTHGAVLTVIKPFIIFIIIA